MGGWICEELLTRIVLSVGEVLQKNNRQYNCQFAVLGTLSTSRNGSHPCPSLLALILRAPPAGVEALSKPLALTAGETFSDILCRMVRRNFMPTLPAMWIAMSHVDRYVSVDRMFMMMCSPCFRR
jgi:hypothetical protein